MREITTHKVNGCNEALFIHVLDKPGSGGACHKYLIGGFIHRNDAGTDDETCLTVRFQNGPIAEVGTNGLTHEALLAILIDRLEGFQSGPFACQANQAALDALGTARHALNCRTRDRLGRGVEGTHSA